MWQFDIVVVYIKACMLLCGSHDTFLDCMSSGVQVTTALWFVLYSSHLCDSEDWFPALTGLAFLAGLSGIMYCTGNKVSFLAVVIIKHTVYMP